MATLSRFYDFYDGPEEREPQFEFYASLFDPRECDILELACGTGIITMELARRGFRVIGIDYDRDMLDIALRKAATAPPDVQDRVRFLYGDMRGFSVDRVFGAVIIPTNSFGYLWRLEDRRSCLRHAYDHLRPGGVLVIEESHVSPGALARLEDLRGVERTWESRVNPQTGKYTMFRDCIHDIDYATQTVFRSTFVDEVQDDGAVRRYLREGDYFGNTDHYFTKIELQLLVESCGFGVKVIWGSHAKQPCTSRSGRIIVVAERPVV